jgi:phage major head subunit gpT-like protein
MATNGSFDDRNVLGMFQTAYTELLDQSWVGQLSLYNGASDRGVETYGILGANSAMREWVGPRQANVLDKKQYEIRNKQYEATMVVPQLELNRDKLGMLQARINTFAEDAGAGHWGTLLEGLINNADGICYDGQKFFDTDHVWGDSGTQTNALTATEVPSSNVGTTTAPTPTEAANIILEMTAWMLTYKNNKGRPVNANARQFIVMVSTAQMFAGVVQAIANQYLAGTVTNPLTGMKQGGFMYTPVLNPNLTNATEKIRLFRMDGPVKPFIRQDEQGIEYQMLGRGSDFYFDNKAIKLGIDASRGAGYGAWEYAAEVTLT